MAMGKVKGNIMLSECASTCLGHGGAGLGASYWAALGQKHQPLHPLLCRQSAFFCDLSSFVNLWRAAEWMDRVKPFCADGKAALMM